MSIAATFSKQKNLSYYSTKSDNPHKAPPPPLSYRSILGKRKAALDIKRNRTHPSWKRKLVIQYLLTTVIKPICVLRHALFCNLSVLYCIFWCDFDLKLHGRLGICEDGQCNLG